MPTAVSVWSMTADQQMGNFVTQFSKASEYSDIYLYCYITITEHPWTHLVWTLFLKLSLFRSKTVPKRREILPQISRLHIQLSWRYAKLPNVTILSRAPHNTRKGILDGTRGTPNGFSREHAVNIGLVIGPNLKLDNSTWIRKRQIRYPPFSISVFLTIQKGYNLCSCKS